MCPLARREQRATGRPPWFRGADRPLRRVGRHGPRGAGRPRPNEAFRHCDRPPGRRRCGRDRGRTAATGSRVRRASSSRRPRGCRVSHRLAWRDAAQRPDPGPRRRPSDRAAGSFGHGAVDRTIPAAGQRHPEAARGVRADADRAAGPESGRSAGSRPDAARRRLGADVAAPAPTPPPHGPRPPACRTGVSDAPFRAPYQPGTRAIAIISTRIPGRARATPQVARAGGLPGATQSSQTAFMPAKSAMSLSQT